MDNDGYPSIPRGGLRHGGGPPDPTLLRPPMPVVDDVKRARPVRQPATPGGMLRWVRDSSAAYSADPRRRSISLHRNSRPLNTHRYQYVASCNVAQGISNAACVMLRNPPATQSADVRSLLNLSVLFSLFLFRGRSLERRMPLSRRAGSVASVELDGQRGRQVLPEIASRGPAGLAGVPRWKACMPRRWRKWTGHAWNFSSRSARIGRSAPNRVGPQTG